MGEKRCQNGHVIDESWDICPFCPPERKVREFPVVRPQRPASSFEDLASPPSSPPSRSRSGDYPVAVPQPDPSLYVHRRPAESAASRPVMERTMGAQKIDPAESQRPRYVVGWLVALDGEIRGESFPIRIGRNVLGRDRRSDIVIPDEMASAHHADLVYRLDERRFILMDHNSTNGTYVNEFEIEPRKDLADRDIIRIGTQRLLFVPFCNDNFAWDDQGPLR